MRPEIALETSMTVRWRDVETKGRRSKRRPPRPELWRSLDDWTDTGQYTQRGSSHGQQHTPCSRLHPAVDARHSAQARSLSMFEVRPPLLELAIPTPNPVQAGAVDTDRGDQRKGEDHWHATRSLSVQTKGPCSASTSAAATASETFSNELARARGLVMQSSTGLMPCPPMLLQPLLASQVSPPTLRVA